MQVFPNLSLPLTVQFFYWVEAVVKQKSLSNLVLLLLHCSVCAFTCCCIFPDRITWLLNSRWYSPKILPKFQPQISPQNCISPKKCIYNGNELHCAGLSHSLAVNTTVTRFFGVQLDTERGTWANWVQGSHFLYGHWNLAMGNSYWHHQQHIWGYNKHTWTVSFLFLLKSWIWGFLLQLFLYIHVSTA